MCRGQCVGGGGECNVGCVEGSMGDSVGNSVAQVLPLHPNNNNNNNNNNITNVETRLGAVGDSLVHRGEPVSEASAEIV